MQQRVKLIQITGEIAIPLLGFFYWNWNIYFIALFLYIDLLANTGQLYFKIKKIDAYSGNKTKILIPYSLVIIGLAALLFAIIQAAAAFFPNFSWSEQTIKFIMLKDSGLPQGFLLIPLVVLASFMQYKAEFIKTNKCVSTNSIIILKRHIISLFGTLALLVLATVIFKVTSFNELAILIPLLLLTASYSYFFKR